MLLIFLAEMWGSCMYRGQDQLKSFGGPRKNLIILGKSHVSNEAACGNKKASMQQKWQNFVFLTDRSYNNNIQ